MSHSDSNFYKSFAFVLGALVLFTLFIIYIANSLSPDAPEDPLAVAAQQKLIAPVSQSRVVAEAETAVAAPAPEVEVQPVAVEETQPEIAEVETAVVAETVAADGEVAQAAIPQVENTQAVAAVGSVANSSTDASMKVRATVATNCAGCHNAGLNGAAKSDDSAAWSALADKGIDALTMSVIHGKGQMPPRAESNLNDAEIQQAVQLMVTNATGAKAGEAKVVAPAAVATTAAVAAVATAATDTATTAATDTAAKGPAAIHTITAVAVKYKPMFTYIEPGDTVNWESMAGHNVETIDSMVPAGVEKINTQLGDNVTAVFEAEGIIVYKCTPHWGARMGGVIVVGKPADAGAIIDSYIASLETDRQNLPAKGLLKKLRKDMVKKGLL